MNKHFIHKIEAGTSAKNIASQNVLKKNGFRFVEQQDNYIFLNGEWHSNLVFEKVI